jgi:muramoyltetrapeptide carboxypeptidase
MSSRRQFLGAAAAFGLWAARPARAASGIVKPPRLRIGDTIGLIAPANATFLEDELAVARETMEALGLSVKVGAHVRDRYGYLAGRDQDRAADVNALFADPEVRAVLALRGGWGSAPASVPRPPRSAAIRRC